MKSSEIIKLLIDGIATYGDSDIWILDNGKYIRPDKISYTSDTIGNKFAIITQNQIRNATAINTFDKK